MEAKKFFFIIGGIAQVLFGIFHIVLGRMIYVFEEQQIDDGPKGLLMVFNISFTIIVFFFAYVSFFCKRDLLYTRLGKSTLGLIALLYILRGAEEGIFFKFSFVVLIPYVLVGAIYLALLLLPNPEDEEEREPSSPKDDTAENEDDFPQPIE